MAGLGVGEGIAAGVAASAASSAPVAAAGTGLTLGQIGTGLGAASSALNIAKAIGGSGQQQGPGGFMPIVGQGGGAGQVPSSVTNSLDLLGNTGGFATKMPNQSIAAPQVAGNQPNPIQMGSMQQNPFQQNPMQPSGMPRFAEGGSVEHFEFGGEVGDINLDDYGNYLYPMSTNTTPTFENTPTQAEITQMRGPEGSMFDWFKNPDGSLNWTKIGMLGLGGAGIASLMGKPGLLPRYQPPTAKQYGLGAILSPNYKARKYAEGGLTEPGILALHNPFNEESSDTVSAAIGGLMDTDMYPMSQQTVSRYATPSQLPAGAHEVARDARASNISGMASGGIAQLAVGGTLLKGPGDGMSDSLKANIDGQREARLADGEFVVPADVVSHLGNGSTDAGAKQLHAMMNKVRKARTGNKRQGKQIKAEEYMPT